MMRSAKKQRAQIMAWRRLDAARTQLEQAALDMGRLLTARRPLAHDEHMRRLAASQKAEIAF